MGKLRVFGSPGGIYIPEAPAVGSLADYRYELKLATDRVNLLNSLKKLYSHHDILLTHSLLDSVAYPTVRVYNMVNSGSVNENELFRWEMVLNMNALQFRDTFPLDEPVIFLKGNDGESFSIDIETAITSILTDWNIGYVTLHSPVSAATMIATLWKEENGQNASDQATEGSIITNN